MTVPFRTIAISGGLAAMVAGAIATPALFPGAFAAEPQSHALDTADQLFAPRFNPKLLRKFDFTLDDSVSTKVERTQTVSKIEFGKRTIVSIVTTPSGTYSSDAIISPNVRYPGIDVSPKHRHGGEADDQYLYSTWTSPSGTWTWTKLNSGSFTFMTSTFKPAKRSRG
jgi:hypothetical protein